MFLELVTIVVDDYDRAIDFFVDTLGFELAEDTPATTNDGRPKRWVVVRPPGAQTGILVARADGDHQRAAVGNQVAGRVGFFLRVDDFDRTFDRLASAGVRFVTSPRDEPYGRFAVFLDIAGNRWDLLGPRPTERTTSQRGGGAVETSLEIRRLARTELSRVGEIDRTERIDVLYEQRGTELVERRGNWSASAWDPDGHGEHSVEAQRHALEHYSTAGGIALGAFSGGQLVGIGAVVAHLRPAIAQLAFLHVSEPFRAAGIGSRLCDDLELIARGAGDTEMVVSATPSENTVRFYLGRGYELMAQPLPELVELEPEDIHMRKTL